MLDSHIRLVGRGRRRAGPGAVSVLVAGDLDARASSELDDVLRDAAATARVVIVDLRCLWMMDLAGAAAIVRADLRIRAGGGRLIVVIGDREVERCFALAGLDGVLEAVGRPPSIAELRADRDAPGTAAETSAVAPVHSTPRRVEPVRTLLSALTALRR